MAAAPMRKRQLKRENAGTVPTMRLVNIKLRPNSMELQQEPSMALISRQLILPTGIILFHIVFCREGLLSLVYTILTYLFDKTSPCRKESRCIMEKSCV